MAEEEGVNVVVGATLEGFQSALRDALGGIEGFQSKASNAFGGIGEAIEKIKGPLIAISGLLAGGAIFKETIDATKKWVGEVNSLSNRLGVSLARASEFAKVLGDLGIEEGVVERAAQILTMRISTNEKKFNDLKIAVRDTHTGALKPVGEVMLEVAEKAATFNDKATKNAFLATTLGRSWASFLPMLRATTERFEEAKKELQEFGIVVDAQSVTTVRDYKEAMHKTGEAMEALKIRIGMQLMPVLTDLAKVFSKMTVAIFPYVMSALYGIKSGIDAVVTAVRILWAIFVGFGEFLGGVIKMFATLAEALVQFIQGDYSKAGKTLKQGFGDAFSQIYKDAEKTTSDIEKMTRDFATRAVADFNLATGKKKVGQGDKDKPAGPAQDFGEDRSKEVMEQAKREMADMVRRYGKLTADQELAFWEKFLAIAIAGGTKYQNANDQWTEKVAGLRAAAKAKRLAEAQADVDSDTAWGEKSAASRYAAEQKKYDLTVARYGAESDEAKAHYRKLETAMLAWSDEEREIEASRIRDVGELASMAMDREEAGYQARFEMGRMSMEELIASERAMEERRYQAKKADLERLMALYELDPAKRREIAQQIEVAEAQHNSKLDDLQTKGLKDYQTRVESFLEPVKASFQAMFDDVMKGQFNFAKSMKALFQSMTSMVIGLLLDMLKKKAAALITDTATQQTTDMAKTTSNAGVAASGAAASQASIPIVGPILAAAAFASILALVLGAKKFSAAGGFDIGRDNPLTQLHSREMVLPAHLAERIRGMTDGGGGNQRPVEAHLHFHAMDGKSVYDTMKANETQVVKFLSEAMSRGRL